MTANAESKYQTLLQVAAGKRLRDDTAALNITYTASVAAVDATTPSANQGWICHMLHLICEIEVDSNSSSFAVSVTRCEGIEFDKRGSSRDAALSRRRRVRLIKPI